jgi:hypothetical protein
LIQTYKPATSTPPALPRGGWLSRLGARHHVGKTNLYCYSGYVHEFKQEHAPLINEKIFKETTLTGTPEELVKRVKAMRRVGVKQIAVHGGTRAGAPKVISDFAKYVIGKG